MRRIKVIQYFWGKLDAGGAETFIINMAENMDSSSFEISYCCYEDKEFFYSKRILDNGNYIVPLQKKESKFLPIRLIKRWVSLYNVLKNGEYDVFHCNCDFAFKFIEMMIAKKTGVKVRVCHSHNTSIDSTTIKGKVSYYMHIIFRPLIVHYSTNFVACSEESARWLFGKKMDIHNVLIAKNGIDANYFLFDKNIRSVIREKMEIGESILLGNVGRFTRIKNQEFIIDMIKCAIAKKINIKACLIGDGEEVERIKKRVSEEQLDNRVLFIGLTDAVRDYLMAFDFYIMPSLYEGLPVSGIEAQATGLQCVVSSSVDKALDITGNVVFKSLEDGPEEWLKTVMDLPSLNREKVKKDIIESGYDISETSKSISRLYINAVF